jgi:hypothetical protein
MGKKNRISVALVAAFYMIVGCGSEIATSDKRTKSDQQSSTSDSKVKSGQTSVSAPPAVEEAKDDENKKNAAVKISGAPLTHGAPSFKLSNGCLANDFVCQSDPNARQGVNACLKAWKGKAPFNEKSPIRALTPGVTVFGIGTSVQDTAKTDAPELVFIPAGVNVLSNSHYRLLNPNGWYCLGASVNVISGLIIDLDSKAQIADGNIDIIVLGNQSNATSGFVSVNVGSSVKVNLIN